MAEFILALVVFIVSHLIPVLPKLRARLVDLAGEKNFLVLYSLMSIGVIYWLGTAYANAPYIEMWERAEWANWVPIIAMPVACILAVAGLTSKNPFSLGAGGAGYDPQRPGIVSVTRHPVLWALAIWTGSHIIPNGDVAGFILFALLHMLSLIGTRSVERSRRARFTDEQWQAIGQQTSIVPFGAAIKGRIKIDWPRVLGWRFFAGLAFYVLMFHIHEYVIGVAPIIF